MRASELLREMDEKDDPFWKVSVLRAVLAMLAATQAAIEELARDAGSGPTRRIAAILDNETKEATP